MDTARVASRIAAFWNIGAFQRYGTGSGGGSAAVDGTASGAKYEPGRHRTPCRGVVGSVPPGLEEDVVEEVFGLGAVAEDAKEHGEQARGVPFVEHAERRAIAARHATDESRVGFAVRGVLIVAVLSHLFANLAAPSFVFSMRGSNELWIFEEIQGSSSERLGGVEHGSKPAVALRVVGERALVAEGFALAADGEPGVDGGDRETHVAHVRRGGADARVGLARAAS